MGKRMAVRQTRQFGCLAGRLSFLDSYAMIGKQIEREPDRTKIRELAKKLNDEMIAEETEKVRNRLGLFAEPIKPLTSPRQLCNFGDHCNVAFGRVS